MNKVRQGHHQSPVQDHVSLFDWLIFILLSIVWGSSFILIKKGLLAFDPVQVGFLRVSFSALAFVPVFFIRSFRITGPGWKYAILVGIFGSGIPAYLYALAETGLQSAVAGILNAMTPIFTLLLGLWMFRVQRKQGQFIGVFIGFLGAMCLIISPETTHGIEINTFALFVILATVSYGISGNIVKRYCQDMHPIALTAISFFAMGWFTLPWLFIGTNFLKVMNSHPEAYFSLGAICLLSLLGTVLANILFFRLIQRTDAVFASSVSYCIPITAVVWGLLDGEHLYWFQFIGLVLILAGIFMLGRISRKRKAPVAQPDR